MNKGTKTISSPIISGLLVGIFVLCIGLVIGSLRYQVLIQHQERESKEVLELIEQNIENTIQESYSVALTLALTVDKTGEVQDFEKVAEQILSNNDHVDVLELVPGGVIEYVYPLEGNESVIGYDILSDPRVNAEVLKAAELGSIYFAGPIDLVQGGQAVIGRLPITINGELWGYSAVLIYLETLIERSGINKLPKDRYYFQLSKVNPNTDQEEFFLPLDEDIVISSFSSVNFPEGDWKLYIKRIDRDLPEASFLIILALSIFGGFILGFMAFKLFKKPQDLKELLQEKSEELLQSREKFKLNSDLLSSILESPKEIIVFSLDRDFNYLAFNNNHKKIVESLFDVNLEVGMNVFDFFPDSEKKDELRKNYSKVISGEYLENVTEFYLEDGSLGYWNNWYSPIQDKSGKIIGLTIFSYNITKKVKAEQQIKVEKNLSDTVINSLPGVFYLFNKEGQYLRWNKNLETVTGYSSEEIESIHPIELFVDEEKELVAEKIESVFENGEDAVEANFLLKDGSKIPFYFTGNLINYSGEECLLGVGIDISEQKNTERKLQNVLKQLQTHLNNSPLGVVEYDNDLNITTWSKKCVEIFGWDESEIHGKNAMDIIYKEDKSKTEVIAEELTQGRVDSNISHNRNYTKSGKVIDCIWYNSVIKDESGQIITVMSLVEDVTENKKIEEQIRQSEKRYRTLVSNSPYCIHELDLDQKIISMNQAGLGMLCLEKEDEIIGTEYSSFVKSNDKERIDGLFKRTLEGESIEFEFEVNDDNFFMSSFIPIKNEAQQVQRVMGITQDITERKRSAETIKNSLKEKTTLLSEIHHRVKNNLAIVSGLLQLQKNEIDDEKVTVAFEQSINRIISIAMVHELMYKSPDLSSVNVHTYLEMLIPAINASMQDESKNIDFKIDIDEYKLNISEAIPLGLLLNELITNSFKYAFYDRTDGYIIIKLSAEDDEITLLYEDNGVGFDEGNDFNQPKNLGLNLIHTQLKQLNAEYKVDTNDKFRLEFKFHVKSVSAAV